MDRVLTLLTAKDTKEALAAFKSWKLNVLPNLFTRISLKNFCRPLMQRIHADEDARLNFLCSTPAGIRKRSLTLILKRF